MGAVADFGATVWPPEIGVSLSLGTASGGQAVPRLGRVFYVSAASSGTILPILTINDDYTHASRAIFADLQTGFWHSRHAAIILIRPKRPLSSAFSLQPPASSLPMPAPLAVVLAAGQSRRMNSDVPKVLHEVCGRMLIDYVLNAARDAGAKRLVVIVGFEADRVKSALSHHDDVEFALQSEQNGTGHAVMMCEPQLKSHDGPVLILAGDTPLLKGESLSGLLEDLREQKAAAVIGTAVTDANQGLGRIIRDGDGRFQRIVEERDATDEQKAIREINTGCYAFDSQRLLFALTKIRPANAQDEYYLTDCPAVLRNEGETVVAANRFDIREAIGVNTRQQLAEVHQVLQADCMDRLMRGGVTIVDPSQTVIDPVVKIGRDTIVFPLTSITGEVVIGENCRIGPHASLTGPLEIPAGETHGPFTHRQPGEL